jgi:PAS domain S-box-containing protein
MPDSSPDYGALPAHPPTSEAERWAIETALRESEERFRAVWEATSEAMALSDPDGIVLDVNPAYCTLYGRESREFIGHSFARIFSAAERTDVMAQYRAVFADPSPPRNYEARIVRPDGTERIVEARADFLLHDGVRVAMISAIRDITERKRAEQAQQDFVAMASHDLSSPLTVLRARAQLLQRRQTYDETSIAAILEQTSRMERLITDLRDFVQVEGQHLSLQQEALDLGTLALEAVRRSRALGPEHVVWLAAPDLPVVVIGDQDRLGQVLDNLLGNAIKYSPAERPVLVAIEADKLEARLSVADQGPGIPADVLPHLFERFYRGQHPTGEPGLGLGLYISRMLVEALGGQLTVASVPGKGSTFTVALPLAPRG